MASLGRSRNQPFVQILRTGDLAFGEKGCSSSGVRALQAEGTKAQSPVASPDGAGRKPCLECCRSVPTLLDFGLWQLPAFQRCRFAKLLFTGKEEAKSERQAALVVFQGRCIEQRDLSSSSTCLQRAPHLDEAGSCSVGAASPGPVLWQEKCYLMNFC